jgi:transposase
MTMTYFAQPKLGRHQFTLFSPTLDEMIPEDHPVRILDELIGAVDCSEFEQTYHGSRGQPPIPPRVLVKVLLYAMSRRIRSSRQIEYALKNHVDFMWLAECHTIDHSTLCDFRKNHFPALKSLFRQMGKLALEMGLVRLNEIAFDGTRVRANNSRYATLTAAGIQERLNELEQQLGEWARDIDQCDEQEKDRPQVVMPAELHQAKDRQQKLQDLLGKVQKMDEERRKNQSIDPKKHPAQIPTTDPDSRVLPNKEGGYAANYTPLAAVSVEGDFIVAVDVLNVVTEHTETQKIVDQVEADFGVRPEAILADGHHATGANIVAFENSNTELISPLPEAPESADNPAIRPDPTAPVPESEWNKLPISPHSKLLDKSCFLYDQETDAYYCPQGQPLPFEETKPENYAGGRVQLDVYRCASCEGCPLKNRCVSPQSKGGRTVRRDRNTEQRERYAAKMATPEQKERYKHRLHAGEVIFAHIKQVLGFRQFLLRGLANVKTEWLWVCTTYNMIKLINHVVKQRQNQSSQVVNGVG